MSERANDLSSPGADGVARTVYFDGACPLCRREVDFYRRRRGAAAIEFVDVSDATGDHVASDLRTDEALARFHVRGADGRLYSGAQGFAALWAALPAFRRLAALFRLPLVERLAERAYRMFLHVRPAMAGVVTALTVRDKSEMPDWLEAELRSDHAGETGAVAIYDGMLAVTRDEAVRRFATHHRETERQHLARIEALLPPAQRSRLLGAWRCAGWLTGAIPALFSRDAVYHTVDAVESFVDEHYGAQIEALHDSVEFSALRAVLVECRDDELAHRDEARERAAAPAGAMLRAWLFAVDTGSRAAVHVARRL